MTNVGVSCLKLSVKGRVFGLGGGKSLGEEGKGGQGAMETLLEDSTHMRADASTAREMANSGSG